MLGEKSFSNLPGILNKRRIAEEGCVIFIVDEFFKENEVFELDLKNDDELFFVETSKKEPTTAYINQLKDVIENRCSTQPCAIVGIGGGSTMDVAKAISNLFWCSRKLFLMKFRSN